MFIPVMLSDICFSVPLPHLSRDQGEFSIHTCRNIRVAHKHDEQHGGNCIYLSRSSFLPEAEEEQEEEPELAGEDEGGMVQKTPRMQCKHTVQLPVNAITCI